MPKKYTMVRERLVEAKRLGRQVRQHSCAFACDPDELRGSQEWYDHDADCRSHGITIVEPEAPPLAPCPKPPLPTAPPPDTVSVPREWVEDAAKMYDTNATTYGVLSARAAELRALLGPKGGQ